MNTNMHSVILIYPPAAKPSEPPSGIARLSGFLNHHGIKTLLLDANIEGKMHLLNSPGLSGAEVPDTWTKRALRNRQRNVASLRERHVYAHPDRYRRAVADINRVQVSAQAHGVTIGLANYQDSSLSPLRH
jgi:hypothetical protein